MNTYSATTWVLWRVALGLRPSCRLPDESKRRGVDFSQTFLLLHYLEKPEQRARTVR